MTKEVSSIKSLESYSYDGKVYVTTEFLAAYFNMDKRNITNWKKKGLEPIKNKAISRSNLFVLQEVIVWVEININQTKSNNRKGGDDGEDNEDVDFDSLDMQGKKEYLRRQNKNKLDELNTAEQIIEREGKNKVLDKNWVRKEKPAQTIKALARSFISLMKNMMITISKEGEQKSQDELYHLMDKYLHVEITKFQKMLQDENTEIDLYELYQIIIDLYEDGVSMDEIVEKIEELSKIEELEDES